jgi:hypothetical protein
MRTVREWLLTAVSAEAFKRGAAKKILDILCASCALLGHKI